MAVRVGCQSSRGIGEHLKAVREGACLHSGEASGAGEEGLRESGKTCHQRGWADCAQLSRSEWRGPFAEGDGTGESTYLHSHPGLVAHEWQSGALTCLTAQPLC